MGQFLVEAVGQPGMTVAVKLHPEGDPAGNPQVAEAEFPVDEIAVVVQALAAVRA